jgi:hypothetical protein
LAALITSAVSAVSLRAAASPRPWAPDATDDLGTYQWFASYRPELVRPDLFSNDRNGIPVVQYTAKEPPRYNPVTIAQVGLAAYSRSVIRTSATDAEAARRCADWLMAHQASDGSWLYEFPNANPRYTLPTPWRSALAQGQAISLLARLYVRTHQREYLTAAQRAMAPLLKPVAAGGLLRRLPDGGMWLEEYPDTRRAAYVLNGFLYTIIGVYDLWAATHRQDYLTLVRTLELSARRSLPLFRSSLRRRGEMVATVPGQDGWPKYDLADSGGVEISIVSPYYLRRVYIPLAEWFALHTGAPEWKQALSSWSAIADRDNVPQNVLP